MDIGLAVGFDLLFLVAGLPRVRALKTSQLSFPDEAN